MNSTKVKFTGQKLEKPKRLSNFEFQHSQTPRTRKLLNWCILQLGVAHKPRKRIRYVKYYMFCPGHSIRKMIM
jgi:hypothetical protein